MPPFQQVVRFDQTTGIVGEIIFDGPHRAAPYILLSADPANNVIARAFFHIAGDDKHVSAEGANTLVFAGIMAFPKQEATSGPFSGALDPTLVLRNEENASFVDMGFMIVALLEGGNIGAAIFASDTTGELRAGAAAGFTAVPNCVVDRQNTPAGPGLAFIRLTN